MTQPDPRFDPLPERELRDALADADLRVLLMVLFHLTADRKWLGMKPKRDAKLIADPDAGLSAEAQTEVRDTALRLLTSPSLAAAITDPDEALMVEMMSACLGEAVPPEYAPLMREELGFASRDVVWPAGTAPEGILIVGAGVSGIALGARLHRLGVPYSIVERNEEVGGVWQENTYPGAGVDTPNHSYSYSFGEHYAWSRYFAGRDQIHDYLRRSATELGVRPHIRFETSVRSATWNADDKRWVVSLQTPEGVETVEAAVLVSAIGQFGVPSLPKIAGAADFGGSLFHSAHWPQGFDVRGKKVAIIGTGASAMQIVPTVIEDVASITVYQRTPQWVRPIPRYREDITPGGRWVLAHVPFYAAWFRFTMWWRYGDGLLPILHKDPTWPHPGRSLNKRNDRQRDEMTAHLTAELGDRQDLIDKSIPDYPPFGKRILLDNGWYQAIQRPNAELVTTAIDHITRSGIKTADGVDHAADVIIYATGFQMTQMAARLSITGKDGLRLEDAWADDNPTAYLGITVAGFPNLFLMGGPNTGLGHGGSTIFQAESQARYITGMLAKMTEEGARSIEVKPEAVQEFVARVDAEHAKMIWTHPGVSTYYRNKHGRVVSVMPFRLVDYWQMTHDPDLGPYVVG